MSSSGSKVVVVGSGLGGLSAAAYAAAAGAQVTLLERYSVLGGSSHVFRRQGRWEFDCGVHYVGGCGRGGAVADLMNGVGLGDRIEWLPMDASGFDRIVGPDFALSVPVGWDQFLDNLLAAFPAEKAAVHRFHSRMRRAAEPMDRFTSQSSIAATAKWLARSGTAAPWMLMPYAVFLTACGFSPRAVLALSTQAGALGASSLEVPALSMAAFFEDYVSGGSYYPRGGGQVLAAGFADVITAHGGTIRTRADVDKITLTDGRVTGVRLRTGEELRADAVISDADVIKTFTDLIGLDQLPSFHRARAKRLTMSHPLINGFFGVDYDTGDHPNSNYFAIPTWDDATSVASLLKMSRSLLNGSGFSHGDDWARNMAAREPMFVQSSSRRDPTNFRAAPEGHSTIEVQTIVPYNPRLWGFDGHDVASGEYRNDPRYKNVKEIVIEGMIDRMEQVFPGSASKLKISELGSPATQERFVGNTGGAAFGLAQSPTQYGPLRPGVSTVIPGLYLVGTSTPYGPGTVGAMVSGVHAASAVSGRNLVEQIRKGLTIGAGPLPRTDSNHDPLTSTRGLPRGESTAEHEPSVRT